MIENTCPCPSKRKREAKRSAFPILTGILIALLPKCPFCILAYSSAITLCSGARWYNHSPGWTSWISIGLLVITLLMILLNYRGKRTVFAAAMVLAGSFLIIRTELLTGDLTIYYYGVFMLLTGVWINASFYYFLRRWIKPAFKSLKKQFFIIKF